jgi:hypothetical protein
MKFIKSLLFFISLSLILGACSKDEEKLIIGSWIPEHSFQVYKERPELNEFNSEFEFTELKFYKNGNAEILLNSVMLEFVENIKWEIDNKKLSLIFTITDGSVEVEEYDILFIGKSSMVLTNVQVSEYDSSAAEIRFRRK